MDKIFENFHGYIHEADCEGVFYGGSFDVVSSYRSYSTSRVPEKEQASLEG